ncbi:hypothetical protein PHLGIDRAFT_123358 [Phlebiopsis gigantea 11061_1 CR5-6]|uniref:Uncharacterized protein n=1 Tax=Phlebiopsis gigantea (strain 11061_1 CR5-6) TaxID=745531 RepID=A0A0C3RYS6_PHLG1|nr:hypothetical protein PHLGIDRAFT_123358 [Phlebiopsis gigantea 11061_1 CR5-6]
MAYLPSMGTHQPLANISVSWLPEHTLTRSRTKLIQRALTEDFVLRHTQVANRVRHCRRRAVSLLIRGKAHPGGHPEDSDADKHYHVTVSGISDIGSYIWTVHIYPQEDLSILARRINQQIHSDEMAQAKQNAADNRAEKVRVARERKHNLDGTAASGSSTAISVMKDEELNRFLISGLNCSTLRGGLTFAGFPSTAPSRITSA